MARTGAQAEWRPEHGSDAAWQRSDTGTRIGRPAQMSLVSSSTMAADEADAAELLDAAESAPGHSALELSAPALSAERWTGYGRDRVYVSTSAGQRVGWLNLVTGDRVLIVAGDESMVELLDGCIETWLADPLNEPDRRGWTDWQRPGEAAVDEAAPEDQTIDLRDGAPIRAFLSRRRRRIQLRT